MAQRAHTLRWLPLLAALVPAAEPRWPPAGRAEAVSLCVCCSLFVYVVCQFTLKGHEGPPEPSLYMGRRERPRCLLPVTNSRPVSPSPTGSNVSVQSVRKVHPLLPPLFTVCAETLSSGKQPFCDVTKGLNDTSPRIVTFNSVQTA